MVTSEYTACLTGRARVCYAASLGQISGKQNEYLGAEKVRVALLTRASVRPTTPSK